MRCLKLMGAGETDKIHVIFFFSVDKYISFKTWNLKHSNELCGGEGGWVMVPPKLTPNQHPGSSYKLNIKEIQGLFFLTFS